MTLVDDGVYERVQKKIDFTGMNESEIKQAVEDFIYHGERGWHLVKWGKDRKGRQRYRWVKGKPKTPEGIAFARKLAEPFIVMNAIESSKSIQDLKEAENRFISFPSDVRRVSESDIYDFFSKKAKPLFEKSSLKELERVSFRLDFLERERLNNIQNIEFLKERYREARTKEEFLEARERLRMTKPRIYYGYKGVEVREARKKYRELFK